MLHTCQQVIDESLRPMDVSALSRRKAREQQWPRT